MRKIKGIFGLEEYQVIELPMSVLYYEKVPGEWTLHLYGTYDWIYYMIDDKSRKYFYSTDNKKPESFVCRDREKIDKAKKVYIYPSSKLSRGLLAKKYKKVLNPWLADLVIVPNNVKDISVQCDSLVFISDRTKTVYLVRCSYYCLEEEEKAYNKATLGAKFRNITTANNNVWYGAHKDPSLNIEDLFDSELEFKGPISIVHPNDQWFYDAVSGAIPKDKVVYDSDVIKALGSEDNKITLESLYSIYEMLKSTDEASKESALKALSVMDYTKVPNSINYVLRETYYLWDNNKGARSSAVKFMFNQLSKGKTNANWRMFNDKFITQEDFDIFVNIVRKIGNYDINVEGYKDWFLTFPFMFQDENLEIHPRIKKTN